MTLLIGEAGILLLAFRVKGINPSYRDINYISMAK
jgi:hypothetical protein